jgi:peptidoglycan/xylan/chitin deacetylase (PgdA/CDA1 family)
MYFSNKNNFFHGIMFHHFHDNQIHKKSQGSIDKDDLYNLIKYIGRKNILDAEDFYLRFEEKKLKNNHVCFTFDDGIKSQFDIALPVLEDVKIKSFFFVTSANLVDAPPLLEPSRYFRTFYFNKVEEFYELFYEVLVNLYTYNIDNFFSKNEKIINERKKAIPIYSIEDIKFRLVRDHLLKNNEYDIIMLQMFKDKKFNFNLIKKNLLLGDVNLETMKKLGHIIGLHSHTHPTFLENLSYDDQFSEYEKNISTLANVLKIKKNELKFMSHPCGSYNKNTLKILNSFGIKFGFRAKMTVNTNQGMKKINNSPLEIAREDHAIIIKMMNNSNNLT